MTNKALKYIKFPYPITAMKSRGSYHLYCVTMHLYNRSFANCTNIPNLKYCISSKEMQGFRNKNVTPI